MRCSNCGQETPGGTPGGLCPMCSATGEIPLAAFGGSGAVVTGAVRTGAPRPPPRASGRSAPPARAGPVPEPVPTGAREDTGENIFGEYEAIAELGRGGMGAVYRARHRQLGQEVALKVMLAEGLDSEDEIKRFRRSAAAASKLVHPHIARIYHFGVSAGRPFITMELVDGEPLSKRVAAVNRTDLPAVRALLDVVRKAAIALHYAHEQGIVHRDIKPPNILVDRQGDPHLVDFGLAKAVNASDPQTLTAAGSALGTLPYMAPEQMEDAGSVDRRADVWALGIVIYEILVGAVPFAGTGFQVMAGVCTRDPEPPRRKNPRIHQDLETICLKALEKEPARRYQTAAELADDLGRYLQGEPIAARPLTGLARLWRHGRRHPWALSFGAAAVLACLALSGWWWTRPATLVVESDPPGVQVRVLRNGGEVARAATPARFTVPAGLYHLEASDPSFESALPGVGDVVLGRGEQHSVRVLPEMTTGRAVLDVEPPGTLVRGVGPRGTEIACTAPWSGDLAIGSWTFTLACAGRVTTRRTLDVSQGLETRIEARLLDRVLWRYGGGSRISFLAAGDLDADGFVEILCACEGGTLIGLSQAGEVEWVQPCDFYRAPQIVDLTGDGRAEILVSRRDGHLVCLPGDGSGHPLWDVEFRQPPVASTADIDGDGPQEVLATWFGMGSGETACLSASGTVRWRKPVEVCETAPIALDVVGGGRLEVAVPSEDAQVVCLDGAGNSVATYRATAMIVGLLRLDRGPHEADDLLVLARDGTVTCLFAPPPAGQQGMPLAVRWTHAGPGPSYRSAVADLDGDGSPEIVGAGPLGVVCLSARGEQLWFRPDEAGGTLALADMDGDGALEIISTAPSGLSVISSRGEPRWSYPNATWAAPADTDGDGISEIVAAVSSDAVCLAGDRALLRLSSSEWGEFYNVGVAGPWFVQCGSADVGGVGCVVDVRSGISRPLHTGAYPPAWDAARRRLLLPWPEGVAAWTPDMEGPILVAPVREPCSLTIGGDTLLAGTLRGQVLALDLASAGTPIWSVDAAGRAEAPPLLLDTDGDGTSDRVLVCTTAAEAVLVTLSGSVVDRVRLPGPVRYPLLPLGPAAADGTVPAAIACTDGTIVRMSVGPFALVTGASWHVPPLRVVPAVLDEDRDGDAEAIVVGTHGGWLIAMAADLSGARWAVHAPEEMITGSIITADLDGDGRTEVASTAFRVPDPDDPLSDSRDQGTRTVICIYDAQGRALARLAGGRDRLALATSESVPLLGARPGATLGWGPWPAFVAAGPPTDEAAALGRRVSPWRPSQETVPTEALRPGPLEGEAIAADFTEESPRARGFTLAAGRCAHRPGEGLQFAQPGSRLVARFRLDRAAPAAHLTLCHRSLFYHGPGYAAISLSLDERDVQPNWEAPVLFYEETIPLGPLAPGDHAIEIRMLPGSVTGYVLRRIELAVGDAG